LKDYLYIDVSCKQFNCNNERVCGDVFLSKKLKEEGRSIVVLSDGLGHGVMANMLSTITATMAMNFASNYKEYDLIAETILKALPVDKEKHSSFATFTIVDIEPDGKASILEYENPQCLIFRGSELYEPQWTCMVLNVKRDIGKEIHFCTFDIQQNDRIVIFSDGVSQAGMGSNNYPAGWGVDEVHKYIKQAILRQPDINSSDLAYKVVFEAYKKDDYTSKDDISCAVLYFRQPRKLLVCTGPPSDPMKDKEFADMFKNFDGRKILCGGTTADIISRELDLKIDDTKPVQEDVDLPPMNYMEGVDLLTEGILTLTKVSNILQNYSPNYKFGKGPADKIVQMLIESDDILLLVGTKINEAYQDANIPIELEARRTIVRRIASILEEVFLKKVKIMFI